MSCKAGSERLKLAKILLSEVKKEPLSWTELEKRLLRQCGTHSKFRTLMQWLSRNEYIIKMDGPGSRGCYRYNPEKVQFDQTGEISIRI